MQNNLNHITKLLKESFEYRKYIKELECHLYLLSLNVLSDEINQAKKLAKKSILLLKENKIEKILTDLKEEIDGEIEEEIKEETKEKMKEGIKENENLKISNRRCTYERTQKLGRI
jgi:hypothetical protein